MDTRTLTQDGLLAEAKERFGSDPLDIAFKCPICGDVATIREFPPNERGAAGQECIGRHIGALSAHGTGKKWEGRGCTFAAYGLIPAPWTITLPDGTEVRSFPLAEPVAILKEEVRREVRPLPLQRFRERLDAQADLFDPNDWGACACGDV